MTVNEAISKLGLSVITLPDGERTVEGGYCGDLLSWVMGRARSGQAWITIMSNVNVIAVATLCDPSCIILAEGVTLPQDIINKANDQGINVLRSDIPAFELCGKLYSLL